MLVGQGKILAMPGCDGALDQHYRQIEGEAEEAGNEDGGPGVGRVQDARLGLDVDAQIVEAAAKELGHNRPDHAQGGADFEGVEDKWQRRRHAQQAKGLPIAGAPCYEPGLSRL